MNDPSHAPEKHVPTSFAIRSACRQIQTQWSEAERRKRAGLPKLDPWIPPIIPVQQFGLDGELEAES